MFIFQTILNVFGSVDLLPLTGVTFPFVSSGGTSMLASWGLLSFLKAADTRQNASFAIRLDKKGEFDNELEGGGLENPEDIFAAVDGNRGGYQENRNYRNYDHARATGTSGRSGTPGRSDASGRSGTPGSPGKRSHGIRNRNDDTTIISSTSSRPKRQVKYENISDDEFFNNLDSIRPGDSFSERYDRVSPTPSSAKKPQGRTSSSGRSGQSRTARSQAQKPQTSRTRPKQQEESQPLTLEDIFGGDKK